MQHSCFWVLSIFHWRVCSTTHTHNGRQLWQYHQHPWQQCPSNRAEPSDSTFPSDKFFLHLGTVPSEIESRRDRTLPFFFFFFTIFFFSFPFFIYLNNALFFSPPETGLHINVRARGGEGYCMVTRFLFDMDWVAAWNRLLCSDPLPGRLFSCSVIYLRLSFFIIFVPCHLDRSNRKIETIVLLREDW